MKKRLSTVAISVAMAFTCLAALQTSTAGAATTFQLDEEAKTNILINVTVMEMADALGSVQTRIQAADPLHVDRHNAFHQVSDETLFASLYITGEPTVKRVVDVYNVINVGYSNIMADAGSQRYQAGFTLVHQGWGASDY